MLNSHFVVDTIFLDTVCGRSGKSCNVCGKKLTNEASIYVIERQIAQTHSTFACISLEDSGIAHRASP
jgi:hypothetical protein